MPRVSGVGPVVASVIQALRATAAVTALVPAARIVNEVAPGTARPFIVVELVTETDDDVLSRGGIDAVVSALIVSEYRGDDEIGRIASALREALDGAALLVDGFADLVDVTYEQAVGSYKDDIAGVVVRHRPLWFRVRAV